MAKAKPTPLSDNLLPIAKGGQCRHRSRGGNGASRRRIGWR
jgi:hypothetical protein